MAFGPARILWLAQARSRGTEPFYTIFLMVTSTDSVGRCGHHPQLWTVRFPFPGALQLLIPVACLPHPHRASEPAPAGRVLWELPRAGTLQARAVTTRTSAVFKHKHFSECCMLLDGFQSMEMVVFFFVNLCSFIIDFWREVCQPHHLAVSGGSASLKCISNWQCCRRVRAPREDGDGERWGYEAVRAGWPGEGTSLRGGGTRQRPGKGFSRGPGPPDPSPALFAVC